MLLRSRRRGTGGRPGFSPPAGGWRLAAGARGPAAGDDTAPGGECATAPWEAACGWRLAAGGSGAMEGEDAPAPSRVPSGGLRGEGTATGGKDTMEDTAEGTAGECATVPSGG